MTAPTSPTDLADVLDATAKQPTAQLRDIRDELRLAAAKLREMEGALKPFADAALVYDGDPLNGDEIPAHGRGAIRIKHLRKARAVIQSKAQP